MSFARRCKSLVLRCGSAVLRNYSSGAQSEPSGNFAKVLREQLDQVKVSGLYREELSFSGPQAPVISKLTLLLRPTALIPPCLMILAPFSKTVCSAQRAPSVWSDGPKQIYAGFEDGNKEVVNFCSSNYLGLANHPDLIKAAQQALTSHGLGISSMRYICGY